MNNGSWYNNDATRRLGKNRGSRSSCFAVSCSPMGRTPPAPTPTPPKKTPKHICHCQKSQTTTWKKHKYIHSCFQGPLTQPNSCWETHTHTHKMGWVWRQRNVSLHRSKQPPRPHTSTIWAPFSPQTQDGSVNMATKTQHVSLSAEAPVMSSSWLNLWHW